MRLELIAPDGTVLDLNPGTRVQLNLVNSAFDSDVLKGSFSYTFSIPNSPKNRLYFGFPEEISSNAGFTNAVSGFRLKSGMVEVLCKVNIQSVSPDAINIYLYTASAILADTLKTKKLRELDLGTVSLSSNPYTGTGLFLNSLPPSLIYIYITSGGTNWLHGVSWYGETLSRAHVLNRLCQRINRKTTKYLEAWSSTTTYLENTGWCFAGGDVYVANVTNTNVDPVTDMTGTWDYRGPYSDWPSIRSSGLNYYAWDFDLEDDPKDYQVIPINGSFLFSENFISGPSFGVGPEGTIPRVLAFMFEKAWENEHTGDVKYFPIRDEKVLNGLASNNCINYWRDGGFVNENVGTYVAKVEQVSVPMLRMESIFNALHDALNLGVDSDGFLDKDFFKSLVVFSNYAAERVVSAEYPTDTFTITDIFAYVFQKNFCTPDVTWAEFLNGIRSMFFMGTWFDYFQNQIKYKPLRDVLTDLANAIDISALVPYYDEISFTESDGYNLMYSHDGSDAVTSEQVKVIEAENVTEIDSVTSAGSLPTDVEINSVALVEDVERYYISRRNDEGDLIWVDYAAWLQNLRIGNAGTTIAPRCSTLPNFIGANQLAEPTVIVPTEYSTFPSYLPGDYVNYSGNTYRVTGILPGGMHSISNENEFEKLTSTTWRVPYSGMDRKSNYYQKAQPCSLRLLSYAGVVPNPESENPEDIYPLATCDLYSAVGVKYPGQYGGSLRWEGEYGLYNQFAKPWLDFLSKAKRATIQIPVTESLLNQMKPWLLLKIRNHYFMWSNLTVDFPIDSGLAKITIHRL